MKKHDLKLAAAYAVMEMKIPKSIKATAIY